MAKYKVAISTVVEASSEEDAVSKVADYLSTSARRMGNDQIVPGAKFTVVEAGDKSKVDNLTDQMEPIEHISVDPEEE